MSKRSALSWGTDDLEVLDPIVAFDEDEPDEEDWDEDDWDEDEEWEDDWDEDDDWEDEDEWEEEEWEDVDVRSDRRRRARSSDWN